MLKTWPCGEPPGNPVRIDVFAVAVNWAPVSAGSEPFLVLSEHANIDARLGEVSAGRSKSCKQRTTASLPKAAVLGCRAAVLP